MTDKLFLSRFTPSRTPAATLEAIFVQRHALADDTVERIRESALTGNKHHILVIGPRGSGKTHFISLVFHRVDTLEDLRDRLRIAWLGEDETTTSFLDLELRIYQALQRKYPEEFTLEEIETIYDLAPEIAEKRLGQVLLKKLAGRTLLIIVENLDELFSGLEEAGQKGWRAGLQENPFFTILATSQQLFEGVARRESPFFGFFQTTHLKALTLDQAVLLLAKIADLNGDAALVGFLKTPSGRSRVRAIHHLSGGNHRIYIVLSEFISRESLDELVGPFEKMVDELTPYYQARISRLSLQQRKIVEFLCTCRQPVPVKEIARRLFLTHQTAASQLKELRERCYVRSQQRGRESLYELTEPLMRISAEVKDNRSEPIRLIIDFLRVWYSREQLERRLETLTPELPTERQYVQRAIRTIDTQEDDLRIRSMLRDYEECKETRNWEEAVKVLQELTETRGQAGDWLALGYSFGHINRFEEALASFDKAVAIKPDNSSLWNDRGLALGQLGRHEEALASFDKVLLLQPEDADAWNNRGAPLSKLGRHEEALESVDKALALQPDESNLWNNRGLALSKLGRHEEALASFDKALALQPDSADTWNNRGASLSKLGRHEEALESIDKALALQPDNAGLWSNRGLALSKLGRHEEALESIDKALALQPEDADAWNNRGAPLSKLGRHEEALESVDKALTLRPSYPGGWNNRGLALSKLGRHEEALDSVDKALTLRPDYADAWNNRGAVLDQLGRHEEALTSFDKVLLLQPEDADAWNNRGALLSQLGHHEEALGAFDKAVSLDPDDASAWHNRVEPFLASNQEEKAFAALREALERFPPARTDYAGDPKTLVRLALEGSLEKRTWARRVNHMSNIYREANALNYLGDGLVRSLTRLSDNTLSADALSAWREVWNEAGGNDDELRIPLRIFNVGIRYLQTQDRRALLDLVTEERKVLAEVLNINLEVDSSS